MTLTSDDIKTIKDLLETLKAELSSQVESQLRSGFVKQEFAIERKLRTETMKITREVRNQMKDLKEATSRSIKETFAMVYEDHPTTEEVEAHLDDLRDETDKRFAKFDQRLESVEQAHPPSSS